MRINNNIRSLFIFFIILLSLSCSGRKNKIDRSDLIPSGKLTEIIADLYLTDGIITLPSIIAKYSPPDSLAAYKDVIEKHGYTIEKMDKTLKFYFIKRPKQLVKIYDQALAKLSEMESRYEQELLVHETKAQNFWKGKVYYTSTDTTLFNVNLNFSSTYVLSFTVTVFPDDLSVNPRMVAYTCHPDSIETGKRKYLKTIEYIKDGQPHFYYYTITTNINPVLLRGDFFTSESDPSGRDMIIENFYLTSTSGAI